MHHPLIPHLEALASLLREHSHLASGAATVKALDKVAISTRTAIDLLEGAAAGASPETHELTNLLVQAFGEDSSEKEAKAHFKPLLAKLPTRAKTASVRDYLSVLAEAAVKAKLAAAAITSTRQYLERPRFDASTNDEYKLLKQIRQLGHMDTQQKKKATDHLLSQPALVHRLCEAAGVPTTTGKAAKPVDLKALVKKLIKHGEGYAENSGI